MKLRAKKLSNSTPQYNKTKETTYRSSSTDQSLPRSSVNNRVQLQSIKEFPGAKRKSSDIANSRRNAKTLVLVLLNLLRCPYTHSRGMCLAHDSDL